MTRSAALVVVAAIAIALLLGVAGRAGLFDSLGNARQPGAELAASASIGGPLALIDHTGTPVANDAYAGEYRLIYFGYTFCPDVCPTSLQVISQALDSIGDAAERVRPIFITVDPERDTAEVLADYVPHFHPRFVGMTGESGAIADVAKAYRVYYSRAEVEGEPDGYLMNHSSIIYLMAPDGSFVKHFSHGVTADEVAAVLREVL